MAQIRLQSPSVDNQDSFLHVVQVIFDREFVHNVPKGPLKGLAEEIAIVSTAVQRGYAVVSVGPHLSGASDRCWTKTWPPEASIEIPELKRAIRHVLEEQKWWGLPRYLLGSSAGGAAALLFATRFPVQAVASLVMGFRPDELFEEKQLVSRNVDQPGGNASWPFPPVFFLEARNDQDIYKERIHRSIYFLKQQGLHAEHVMMEPYALTPATFSERVPDITFALSSTLYEELQAAGIVNATGFTMYPHDLEDRARQDDMRETLFGILVKHFTSKLGKTGPLHDGYMRVFIEMFYASQASELPSSY
ncbi:hypothetical protein COCSUDRAFT_58942 [Coccomyxa subellipsoidea C-169]|uniref:Alpha/beta-hydrolase n=1 Tax=Coccomyxa subellipsoidea (strain C-169) TaxID=574566 RepID=I0Z6Y6_COCSC|nr:hypothetical protein COCSUDRAFT_58942 [Coccomyxa subellipsoidea C-169]EIE26405.1 hypothetical protein COCSUDRAFT_58942 [Coccomyxa subellipsoidea C-169]|eukprot:XP_005650949.1 hypothetical protein COCSUDRAFT_58942 [Coccomyxa subellipsoidea C-169]